MTNRRTSPLVKALAWFIALIVVFGIIGVIFGESESEEQAKETAARQAEIDAMAAEAMALMSPEERTALEESRKAEAAEEAARKRRGDLAATSRFECREAIRRNLHDPRSAEWGDWPGWPASVDGDVVTVQAQVRAKNAFGATVLGRWECRVDSQIGTVGLKQR